MRHGPHGQPTDPTGLRKRRNKRSKRYFDHLRPLHIKTQVQCMLCANQCRTRGICEEFLCHLRSVELRSTLRLSYKCAGRAPRCPMSYVHILIIVHIVHIVHVTKMYQVIQHLGRVGQVGQVGPSWAASSRFNLHIGAFIGLQG